MKLKVPFYKSIKDTDCGPLALRMALAYFGENHTFEDISKQERQLETGLVWSVGIARASKIFGFKTKLVSTNNFSHEEDIDYYKQYSNDSGKIVLKELSDEIKKIGVEIEERNISLEELLKHVSRNSIPILLVNWFVIANRPGFSGHFLLITGYDKENIYVHNPGIANARAHLSIKKEIFVRAWESKGTDKDAIVIFRKLQG